MIERQNSIAAPSKKSNLNNNSSNKTNIKTNNNNKIEIPTNNQLTTHQNVNDMADLETEIDNIITRKANNTSNFTTNNTVSDSIITIRVIQACNIPDALGVMQPYLVFDWNNSDETITSNNNHDNNGLGRACTQAVMCRVGNGNTISNDDSNCFEYNSILKFRTPTNTNNTNNTNIKLYEYLKYAPPLSISVYNRNESVCDELLCQTTVNCAKLYDDYTNKNKNKNNNNNNIKGAMIPLYCNTCDNFTCSNSYVIIDLYLD